MIRRARIVLITATVLFTLFALAVGGVLTISRTDAGREQVRRFVISLVRGGVHGSIYIGHITDGFLTGVTVDSLAIRDPDDSLFLSTGPVTLHYDIRDLLDRRILLRGVRAEHPLIYIRQHEDGTWNFNAVFPPKKTLGIKQGRGFGDYIVIDSAVVHDATFLLTLPWHPAPWLHGAARDSALHFELTRKDHEIRRTREGTHEGFARTWRWTGGNATLLHGRVADPDSVGRLFVARDVSVAEADPPFLFHNVQATLRQLGDSIWVDAPHFDLPASTGRARGKIWWGGPYPVRYAIHVTGDSVSMRDVAWVYPTLPRTGGGRTELDIVSEPRHPNLTDYILTNMDVRSTRSHVTGRMTFTLGLDTLLVKDVQLAASPVNFDLLRTLNGKPFPYDWQGDVTGTVRASGGNLARFKVEDAQVTFADAHVPGAITRGSARGELNIFTPALTAFHGFAVNVATLDLRTLQYLNKEFPKLRGTVSGTATLDSSWLDVRFRNADLVHHDDDAPVSRVTGNGRVTWGTQYLTYDLTLQADSVSFTTLSRSYPYLPLRGNFAGPVRVQGESPDLRVSAALAGSGGMLTYDGRVDADPPVYAAHGTGTFSNARLRPLLDRGDVPQAIMNGSYTVDLTGDTLPHLSGTASLVMAPSTIGTMRLDSSLARVHVDQGLAYVDTLVLRTANGRVDAHGSVATTADHTGSLAYALTVDSLGALNRFLDHPLSTPIGGRATLKGVLSGTPSALSLGGTVEGHDLSYGTTRVRHLTGTLALADLTHTLLGTATLAGDSLVAGGVVLDSVGAALRVLNEHDALFDARFVGSTLRGDGAGRVSMAGGRTDVQIDSAHLSADSANSYTLDAPVHIVADTHAVAVDSALFTRRAGGAIALRALRLAGDSVHGSLRTSGFTLALLQLFTTAATNLSGALTAAVDVDGTLAHPYVHGAVTVQDGTASIPKAGTHFDHITADIVLDGDTVRVKTLSAQTSKERRGTVNVSGTVAVAQYDNPVFDLRATAHNIRAVDRRGLATLDVSTATPISITGPYRGAVVRGGIRVDRGTVYIPELVRKRVIDLNDPQLHDVVDTVLAQNRALLPQAPSTFTQNLRLEDVAVHVGDDVWLRSAEANIKLGGTLNVTLGTTSSGVSQLALEGELSAVRGTYRLNIVPLVQPVFDVERGTLRFYGTRDLDPALDITAINTVRKPQQSVTGQDIRIRATIGGTLSSPTLTLSSADNLPLTQSDLLSYLITGEPAFALDYTQTQYVNQLAAAALRSAGSAISSAIPRSLFDVVDVQTPGTLAGADAQFRLDNNTFYNLLNTRAVFGKQLNNNLFLNFSTGFCAENFRNNLGLRLEYRFNQNYTGLLGLEPGSSDLACARAGASTSVQQTPPQFGLDLSRIWHF